jgi:hypothetical protein
MTIRSRTTHSGAMHSRIINSVTIAQRRAMNKLKLGTRRHRNQSKHDRMDRPFHSVCSPSFLLGFVWNLSILLSSARSPPPPPPVLAAVIFPSARSARLVQ